MNLFRVFFQLCHGLRGYTHTIVFTLYPEIIQFLSLLLQTNTQPILHSIILFLDTSISKSSHIYHIRQLSHNIHSIPIYFLSNTDLYAPCQILKRFLQKIAKDRQLLRLDVSIILPHRRLQAIQMNPHFPIFPLIIANLLFPRNPFRTPRYAAHITSPFNTFIQWSPSASSGARS